MKKILGLAALAFILALVPDGTHAKSGAIQASFHELDLIAVPTAEGETFDTSIVGVEKGMKQLRAALDYLYRTSPFSVRQIRSLRGTGRVLVVYDPHYPFRDMAAGSLGIAAFFPDYFKRDSTDDKKRKFLVVVGRHGIKWPVKELAQVIVHELVGHGIQHLRGRLDYVRVLDLECEASLYEEKFIQEAGFDKKSPDVINFRQSLEHQWCSDFKAYMVRTDPKLLKLWDVLNPNIPVLLTHYRRYIETLRRDGTAEKAIQKANELSAETSAAELLGLAYQGNPKAQMLMGVRYLKGNGVEKNPAKAAKWFRKAAKKNQPDAQYMLALMYLEGTGVDASPETAMDYLRKAASQGHELARQRLEKTLPTSR